MLFRSTEARPISWCLGCWYDCYRNAPGSLDNVRMFCADHLKIVGIVDTMTCVQLAHAGFTHRDARNPFRCFPPRPWSLLSERTPEPAFSYWYRPHRSKTKQPVVFLHGIGVRMHVAAIGDLLRSFPRRSASGHTSLSCASLQPRTRT